MLKSTTAHLFHVGDARIYRVRGEALEQLTQDHRVWVSQEQSYLSRAFGMQSHLDIDYQALQLEQGDVFFSPPTACTSSSPRASLRKAIAEHAQDLDAAARAIVAEALERGSIDNLTAQIVRIEELPEQDADEIQRNLTELPFPPVLVPRDAVRRLSHRARAARQRRSHVYLATDDDTRPPVVIKTLSTELRTDAAQLERFLMEDWIARRISNAHVVQADARPTRARNFIYTVTEFIDGQTLPQWMIDNPEARPRDGARHRRADREGLTAFHRLEMLHQDLRPAERHDRPPRHGEDRGLRFHARRRHRGDRRARRGGAVAGHGAVHGAGIFSRRSRARRAPTCSRSASSPTRCCRAGCRTARRCRESRTRAAQRRLDLPLGARRRTRDPGVDR